jgi:predicted nucleic acid-binding Zn ribbon protein
MLKLSFDDRISARRFSLEPAGAGLEKIVTGALHRAAPGEAPLTAWPLACGSVVAERTRAVKFSDGVLSVQVPDIGWKRELQILSPRYLSALNRYAGTKIDRIEFVIRQP